MFANLPMVETMMVVASAAGVIGSIRNWLATESPRAVATGGYFTAFGLTALGMLMVNPYAMLAGALLIVPTAGLSAYLTRRTVLRDDSPINWTGLATMGALAFGGFACFTIGMFWAAKGLTGIIDPWHTGAAFTSIIASFAMIRRLADRDYRERLMDPDGVAEHTDAVESLKQDLLDPGR